MGGGGHHTPIHRLAPRGLVPAAARAPVLPPAMRLAAAALAPGEGGTPRAAPSAAAARPAEGERRQASGEGTAARRQGGGRRDIRAGPLRGGTALAGDWLPP